MKAVRELHLYLSVLCAPLILYFCLSGAWQLFGFHNIPRGETPTTQQRVLHALSMPHTHSTPPGGNPRADHQRAFDFAACIAALCLVTTALLGLALAWKFGKRPVLLYVCFGLGLLPIILMALAPVTPR